MADDTDMVANGGANMKGHVATYSSVIGLLKWGALACAIIAFGVILLIS